MAFTMVVEALLGFLSLLLHACSSLYHVLRCQSDESTHRMPAGPAQAYYSFYVSPRAQSVPIARYPRLARSTSLTQDTLRHASKGHVVRTLENHGTHAEASEWSRGPSSHRPPRRHHRCPPPMCLAPPPGAPRATASAGAGPSYLGCCRPSLRC